MQEIEGKPIKLKGKSAEFIAKDFTTTNFATAEDKAKWANKFTTFILGSFQRKSFKKEVYKQLHHMFGHCAEYDLDGFYYTWFEDTYKCLHWLETIAATWLSGIGQSQFTWSNGFGTTTSMIRLPDIYRQRQSRKSVRRSSFCRIDMMWCPLLERLRLES